MTNERQSPKSRKLADLLALAGLSQAMSAGPMQQAQLDSREHDQRVQAALSFLGLQQQQQGQADLLDFHRQQASQGGAETSRHNLAEEQQQANLLGFHERQMGVDTARNDELNRHNLAQETAGSEALKARTNVDLLQQMQHNAMPGAPMGEAEKSLIQQINPALVPVYQKQHDEQQHKAHGQALSDVQAIYSNPNPNMGQALGAQETRYDPSVWSGLPWDELNASINPQPSSFHQAFEQGGLIGAASKLPGALDNANTSIFNSLGHIYAGNKFDAVAPYFPHTATLDPTKRKALDAMFQAQKQITKTNP